MRFAGRVARLELRAGARAVADNPPSAGDMENVKRTLAAIGWAEWCSIKNGWRPVNPSVLRAFLRADRAELRQLLADHARLS